jgi:RimJ/RimL family protein N-acetyltransferase
MSKFNPITTERLILRDFVESDLVQFAAYRSDPQVARYQSWETYDIQMAEAFFAKQQALAFDQPGSWYQIAIADKQTNELIGDCVIHFIKDDTSGADQQVELGFTLATDCQSQGYGGEGMDALMDLIFIDLNKHRAVAFTDELNKGAIALLERMGFRQEAHFTENILFKGCWGSEYLYAMLRKEYLGEG